MPDQPRVVSLLPSATEIVCELGGRDLLVGRSHECDHPGSVNELPVCSFSRLDAGASSRAIDDEVKNLLRDAVSLYGLHTDLIRDLRPTYVITQTQCDVCAVSLTDVQAALNEQLGDVKLIALAPQTFDEVLTDHQTVADALGLSVNAFLRSTDERLARLTVSASPPSVLCIEWTDPPMVAGNWVPGLVHRAGGQPLLVSEGEHSPYITAEQIADCDADVVVFMPCGFDLPRTIEEAAAVIEQPPFASLRAVREERVFAVDASAFFNRPGPRLVDSIEILSAIFAGHSDGDGSRWSRLTF